MRAWFADFYRACRLQWLLLRWGAPLLLRGLLRLPTGRFSMGYRLRLICEEMGVTYVKLGQYLAMRYDILPAEICRELGNLLNQVAPMDFAMVRNVVESELDAPLESNFLRFEEQPVGAASIAQVHRAVSLNGQLLAIKVQRPEVESAMKTDIRNLLRFAWLADRFSVLGAISMVEFVAEVAAFTLREVDFIQEGRMADQIREESPSFVKVPEIRWDLTTRRVLAMEFIEGVSMLEICELADSIGKGAFQKLLPEVNPEALIDNLATACLRQLFVTGRFHGDPHFANVIICRDGRIGFVDFGIFGSLTTEQREAYADLLAAMTAGFHEKAYRCYLKLATPTADTDLRAYREEMLALLSRWHQVVADPTAASAEKLSAAFQTQVFQLMRRHRVRTHADQILFWRTLSWLDVMANRVPVEVNLLELIGRFFESQRPSRWQRFVTMVEKPARAEDALDFVENAPNLSIELVTRLSRVAESRNEPVLRAVTHRGGDDKEPTRQLVLALAGAALAILAADTGLGPAIRSCAGVACALSFGAAVREFT